MNAAELYVNLHDNFKYNRTNTIIWTKVNTGTIIAQRLDIKYHIHNTGLLLCRSVFDAGLSCRRRSCPGGPCRNGMDTAGSPIVDSRVLSKINKKRTWLFTVFINKIRKYVNACICSVVLLLSIFNNMQMILLCSHFFCSCLLKQFKHLGYQQLRIFICNNVQNHNYSCSFK